MGCLAGVRFWRKKKPAIASCMEEQQEPGPRPYIPTPAVSPGLGRMPSFVDEYNSDEDGDSLDKSSSKTNSLEAKRRPQHDSDPIGNGIQEKDDEKDGDDSEERRRKEREREAARKKAEQEEQERLDFFQFM